jgi:hypothetical protein
MSKKTIGHKFSLQPKAGATGLSTGSNMELYMDGKLMKGVSHVSIDLSARSLAKLTIEVYGNLSVDLTAKPKTKIKKL